MKKLVLIFSVFAMSIVFFAGCKKEELSSKKEILALIFDASKNSDLTKNVLGEITGTSITAEVPFSVNVTKLIPTLELSPRATVSPEDGVVTDFTNPVSYTVTAEDKSTKVFTIAVTFAPAPYIGNWEDGAIDFGLGLMRIAFTADAQGNMTLEIKDLMTGEVNVNSIKGTFDPKSKPGSDIMITQTHRWANEWIALTPGDPIPARSMRYDILAGSGMKFYYAQTNPVSEWWFQVNLTKQ